MKVFDVIHGYELKRIVPINELNATLYQFTHLKTGQELVWTSREEENKTFGIVFETLPWDDTGVFHILEHSVLCGSDKYPVKEPFLELMKNSMNTFLNAMTFPDKTMYPVSSKNNKDFLNLMRVYLDAVFHPSIYRKQEIFHQEGWHYEFDENDNVLYKGVVFNEMKGAFASADRILYSTTQTALFPETPYAFISGGDPEKIPNLTYSDFLDSHRKFYSPSNSYVFLDGDMEIESILAIIDEEYLRDFERTERIAPPKMQKPFNAGTVEAQYEIGQEENEDGKTRIALGTVIGPYNEYQKVIAMQILGEVLCGTNLSPLCKKILAEDLAEDLHFDVNDGVSQPWVMMVLQNVKECNLEKAEKVLYDEIKRIIEDGIDREQLLACMANKEFNMRERDFGYMPQGLAIGFQMMESWLYGGQPEAFLQIGDLFSDLRQRMQEGYFEELLREVILENPHRCKVILTPSKVLGEERRRRENQRLAMEQERWSPSTKADLRKQQAILEEWQHSEDTPDQLATLPHLKLEDIQGQPEDIPTEVFVKDDITIIRHKVDSNGIVYVNVFFDVNGCSEEELSALSLLTECLGQIHTNRSTVEELTLKTRLLCGTMEFYATTTTPGYQKDVCECKLVASFSALSSNIEKATELAIEILTESKVDEEQEIRNIIRQKKTSIMKKIVSSGDRIASNRVIAQFAKQGVADDCIRGLKYFQWLKSQEENWDWSSIQTQLKSLMEFTVTQKGLTFSVTENEDLDADVILTQLKRLPIEKAQKKIAELMPWGKCKEGIQIPADISFAVRGGDMYTEPGVSSLASKIIGLAYLWNVIRVQGGAYGTNLSLKAINVCCASSYRDPNGRESLEKYLGCADFLRHVCNEKQDLTGFIVGAVSSASPLLTAKGKSILADIDYWNRMTYEERCANRRKLLNASYDQLLELADHLEKAMREGGICIVGGENQLANCDLDRIIKL